MADSSSPGTCQAKESGRAGRTPVSRKDGGQLGSRSQTSRSGVFTNTGQKKARSSSQDGFSCRPSRVPPPPPPQVFGLSHLGRFCSKLLELTPVKWSSLDTSQSGPASSSELTGACCGGSTPQIVGGDWCRWEGVTHTCGLENLVPS